MNPNGIFYRTGSISRRVVIPYAELDVLERKHAMKALMVVREKGSMNKTELVESIASGASSVSTRIEELSEAGLFRIEEESVRPFRKLVSLTERGAEVAELTARIHESLSSQPRRPAQKKSESLHFLTLSLLNTESMLISSMSILSRVYVSSSYFSPMVFDTSRYFFTLAS